MLSNACWLVYYRLPVRALPAFLSSFKIAAKSFVLMKCIRLIRDFFVLDANFYWGTLTFSAARVGIPKAAFDLNMWSWKPLKLVQSVMSIVRSSPCPRSMKIGEKKLRIYWFTLPEGETICVGSRMRRNLWWKQTNIEDYFHLRSGVGNWNAAVCAFAVLFRRQRKSIKGRNKKLGCFRVGISSSYKWWDVNVVE